MNEPLTFVPHVGLQVFRRCRDTGHGTGTSIGGAEQLAAPNDHYFAGLSMLHWSQRGLAEILYCDDRLVRRWAQGSEPVPESIARWIEQLANSHEASPPPTMVKP